MEQHSVSGIEIFIKVVSGQLDQFFSSKRNYGGNIGHLTKHSSMNDHFISNYSLKIIEIFRIKDNFVYHKVFSRKN